MTRSTPDLEVVCFTGDSGLTDYSVSLCRALSASLRVRLSTSESIAGVFRRQGFEVETVFRRSRHYALDVLRFWWRMLRARPPVILMQAPLKVPLFEALLVLLWRAAGIRVTLAIHDVLPHYPHPWSRVEFALFYRCFDQLVVHSPAAAQALRDMGVRRPSLVVPHGVYDLFCLTSPTRADARRVLGGLPPDQRVVLFFGHLEPRKGLLELLKVAERLQSSRPDITFLIAGDGDITRQARDTAARREAARRWPNVVLHDRRIPYEEVERYFAASDIVALPYLEGTTSGVLKLAQAFGVPVVATDVGDLASEVPPDAGIVFPAGDGLDQRLEQALLDLLDREAAATRDPARPSPAAAMRASAASRSWTLIAAQYAQFLGFGPAHPKLHPAPYPSERVNPRAEPHPQDPPCPSS